MQDFAVLALRLYRESHFFFFLFFLFFFIARFTSAALTNRFELECDKFKNSQCNQSRRQLASMRRSQNGEPPFEVHCMIG